MRDFKVAGHVIFKNSFSLVPVDIIGHTINSTNGVAAYHQTFRQMNGFLVE